ncbi:MAG TPA: hypothetical protein PKZ44_12055 [Flavobacterium sp.]|nr:hypothetical protein [Flavobacterium sp.]
MNIFSIIVIVLICIVISVSTILVIVRMKTKKKLKVQKATLVKHDLSVKPPKNKWLHQNDSFGKLEKGVVSNSKTHLYEERKGSKETDFEIRNKNE